MAAVNKNKLLDNATKYIQKGQVDRAIKELQKVIEADPADVRTRLKLGDLFAKKNQNAEAAEQYNLVAESYSKDGFYLKAVAVYKQILKLDSTLIDVHLKLGDLYHQLGLLSDAMSQYQIVAQHYDSKGMAKESLATLRKMVELDPENIQSRKKLAEIIAREGQTAEAIAEFQKIAEDLKSKARLDDLAGVLERIVHLDSTNLETVRELAALYLDRGDPKRALAKLQICFRANPHDLGTLEMLSKAFVSLGQPEKAKSVYREIAKIHEAAGNAAAKMDAFRSILQLDPNDGEARAVVEGRAAPEPSVAAYEEISVDASMPAPPMASEQPRAPTAAPVAPSAPIASVLADDPQTISKLLTEADVYLKYGLLEKALDHLRNIVRRNPGNVDAHLKLKDVYLQHKDIEGAVAEILAVIEICEQAGDEARAAEALQEGLRFAPGHASLEGRGAAPVPADPSAALWNSGEPEVEEPLGADAGEVEISIDGGEEASEIVIDPAPAVSDFSSSEIQIPDEEAEIQVDSGQFDDPTSIEVDAAPLEANPIGIDASLDVSVVDDIAIDAGEIAEFDAELEPPPQPQPRAAVVSLEARRNEISARSESPRGAAPESIQMPVPAAISADQLLDELASAFDATGGEMRAAGKEEIEFSAPEALSFDEPRRVEPEIEEVEIEADPGISADFEPLGPPPTAEERFGTGGEHELPGPSPMPEFPLDADLSSSSGITDFSVDLSSDEISLSSDEPLADDAALALETDDAFAVDEPAARPVLTPAVAPPPPTQASAAAALAAATALNADPIPPEIADDVDEADFFVKQEIYDEAISVYKRLLKKFPGNGGLTERMARAQALLNGEASLSAPPPLPLLAERPKAAPAVEARVEPRIEVKAEPRVEPRVEVKKPAIPVVDPPNLPILEPEPKGAQIEAHPVVAEKVAPPPSRPEPVEETGGFDLAAELMAELDEIAEEEEDAQPSFDETEQVSVADVLREFRKGVDKQVGMEDKQARYDLGIAYREMGLLEEAIGEFLIASADAARKADCYNMMGLCQRDKGDVESAIKSFSVSIQSPGVNNKQKAAFFYELATCLDQKGEPSKALQAFKQVQALDPGFRDVVDKIKKLGGDEGPSMKKIGYV